MSRVLEHEIIKAMADAMLNESYYRHRSELAGWRDSMMRIFVAVTASSALAAASESLGLGNTWKALVGLATISAIASPILQLAEKSKQWAVLASKWSEIAGRLRILDIDASAPDREKRFFELLTAAELLQKEDTTKADRKLIDQLQAEVRQSIPDRLALLPALATSRT